MSNKMLVEELRFNPSMKILNEEQMTALHWATLEVLEKTGVGIKHPKALEIMAGAGCKVAENRVRIPADLVEKAISTARKDLVLGNRDNSRTIALGPANTYFGPTIDCVNYLDPASQEISQCTGENVAAMTRLVEVLQNYDWVMTLGIARDYPEAIMDLVVARLALEHCTKPVIVSCNTAESLREIYEMAQLCRGDEESLHQAPLLGTLNCTISPLVHDDHLVEKNIYAAEKGIPIVHFSGMQLGATCPVTMAAGIVLGSAESLSGLVLQQIINPGAPFIYGSFMTIMDMRSTIFSYGAIEMAMMVGGIAQMAQKYGLPFFGTGGCTDAKEVDAQAAAEGGLQDLVMATVGGGLVHDAHCWLDHGNTLSPAYMVLGEELLAMAKQFSRGIDVTSETLALDLIDKVGPGGNFLMEPHTMQNFKNVYYPEILQRSKALDPGKALSDKFEDRLRRKTLELMGRPQPNPLPPEVVAELDARQKSWFQGK